MMTTIRTNEVVMTKMPGTIVKIVSRAKTCNVAETSCGLFAVPTSTLTLGINGAAAAVPARKNEIIPAQIMMRNAQCVIRNA